MELNTFDGRSASFEDMDGKLSKYVIKMDDDFLAPKAIEMRSSYEEDVLPSSPESGIGSSLVGSGSSERSSNEDDDYANYGDDLWNAEIGNHNAIEMKDEEIISLETSEEAKLVVEKLIKERLEETEKRFTAKETAKPRKQRHKCQWMFCDWNGGYTRDNLAEHIHTMHYQLQPYREVDEIIKNISEDKRGRKLTKSWSIKTRRTLQMQKKNGSELDRDECKDGHRCICLWYRCKRFGVKISQSELETHLRTHTGTPTFHACLFKACDKRFRKHELLSKHMSEQHGIKNDKGKNVKPLTAKELAQALKRESIETYSRVLKIRRFREKNTRDNLADPKVGDCFQAKTSQLMARLCGDSKQQDRARQLMALQQFSSLVHDQCVEFRSEVVSQRLSNKSKTLLFQVRWTPCGVLKDDYYTKEELHANKTRRVPFLELPGWFVDRYTSLDAIHQMRSQLVLSSTSSSSSGSSSSSASCLSASSCHSNNKPGGYNNNNKHSLATSTYSKPQTHSPSFTTCSSTTRKRPH